MKKKAYNRLVERAWKALKKDDINPFAFVIYLYLLDELYTAKANEIERKDSQMAKSLNMSRSTVINSRAILKKLGLIKIKNSKPIVYSFDINDDIKKTKKKVVKKTTKKKTVNKPKLKDKPSFDEFIQYAKSLSSYNQGIKKTLELQYNKWSRDGWKKDGKIINWKQALKDKLNMFSNTLLPNIKRP